MPSVDMRVIVKTPLLRDYEGFTTNIHNRGFQRISNTTIIKKDDNRKIKLMDLPYSKKNSKADILIPTNELPSQEQLDFSKIDLSKVEKEKKKTDYLKKLEEDILDIPMEGQAKKLL